MSFGASGGSSSNQSQQQSQSYGQTGSASQTYNNQATLQPLLQNIQQSNAVTGAGYTPYGGAPLNLSAPNATYQDLSNYQAPQVSAGQVSSTDLSPYLNPYTSDVINTSLNDINRQQAIADQGAASQATQSGAFGGDRSAVLQNLTDDSYARAAASTAAGLNQANYTNAQTTAQGDIANRLSAAFGNQQASLGAAQQRAGAAAGLSANDQAAYGANWNQYLNAQQYPALMQQLRNQAYGLLPSGPLSSSVGYGTNEGTSSGSSSGSAFNFGISGGAGGK